MESTTRERELSRCIGNTTATISLDKSSYTIGDSAKVTIHDPDANIDPNVINTVQVTVTSTNDTSINGIIIVQLTETSPNSGIFEGTFEVSDSAPGGSTDILLVDPSSGDHIKLSYDETHPRAEVVINGVTQNGTAQIKEVILQDNPSPLTAHAVEITLADGAQLAQPTNPVLSQVCGNVVDGSGDGGGSGGTGDGGNRVQTCGGNITITMSYANVPLTFERTPVTVGGGGGGDSNGNDTSGGSGGAVVLSLTTSVNTIETVTPSELTVYEKVGDSWIDLSQFGPVTVDENTKTVTAVSPFGPGIFVIGVQGIDTHHGPCHGGCGGNGGGGGGGGIPLPGSGVVLDFIAGFVLSPPPPPVTPPTNTPPSITPLSNSAPVRNLTAPSASMISTSSDNSVSLTGGSPLTTRVVEQAVHKATSLEKHSGNRTISIPGEGNVTLSFASLVSGDNLWISVLKTPSELVALNITNGTSHRGEILTTLNKTRYSVIGTVFNIGPADIRLNGTLTVSIPYHASLVTGEGSQARMLHFSGTAWEDVTTLPPANGHSVTGTLISPGPVVAGARSN